MFKLLAIMFSLLVAGVNPKTFVSVRMTSPVTLQNSISKLQYGYWAINQKRIESPSVYIDRPIRQNHNTSYWPVNATHIGGSFSTAPAATINAAILKITGIINSNPYYGLGLFINWTETSEVHNKEYKHYVFYYKRINLSTAPLSQICLQNCYCKVDEIWPC